MLTRTHDTLKHMHRELGSEVKVPYVEDLRGMTHSDCAADLLLCCRLAQQDAALVL